MRRIDRSDCNERPTAGGSSPYEEMAGEYYDATRHPTCANFAEGSRLLLRKWLGVAMSTREWICEVGAGRSLLAELCSTLGHPLHHALLTDLSYSMLSYSLRWKELGATLAIADARCLPFASDSLSVLVSSLGDPYNYFEFWHEVFRVLKPGGTVQFTMPSHAWAASYRSASGATAMAADFETADGRVVRVPSVIYPEEKQRELIQGCGLAVVEVGEVRISQLTSPAISPKLLVRKRGVEASVVTGYLITKPS